MGRNCGHFLSSEDEDSLILHVRKKFPIVVLNSTYPLSWDRRAIERASDAKMWIMADERALEVLLDATSPLNKEGNQIGWQIRSSAYSCIEWNRCGLFDHGRLYLNTTGAPIWKEVSARVGDDVERSFERACRWLKSHCVNVSRSGSGFWVSHDLVPAYEEGRKKQEAWHKSRPKDPRDARFYKLTKMSKKRRTKDDVAELIRYCEAMIEFVRDPKDDTALKGWEKERNRLLALLV